jgi:hypothetical protein
MSFITDEVKAKRAANLKETEKKMEALRRNEVSRFFKEGIPEFCEEVRKIAVDRYLMEGKLPDKICICDHDRRITPAVNNPRCRKALLEKLQSLEEKVCDVEFRYVESNPWVITPDPCVVVYFSNNQE